MTHSQSAAIKRFGPRVGPAYEQGVTGRDPKGTEGTAMLGTAPPKWGQLGVNT